MNNLLKLHKEDLKDRLIYSFDYKNQIKHSWNVNYDFLKEFYLQIIQKLRENYKCKIDILYSPELNLVVNDDFNTKDLYLNHDYNEIFALVELDDNILNYIFQSSIINISPINILIYSKDTFISKLNIYKETFIFDKPTREITSSLEKLIFQIEESLIVNLSSHWINKDILINLDNFKDVEKDINRLQYFNNSNYLNKLLELLNQENLSLNLKKKILKNLTNNKHSYNTESHIIYPERLSDYIDKNINLIESNSYSSDLSQENKYEIFNLLYRIKFKKEKIDINNSGLKALPNPLLETFSKYLKSNNFILVKFGFNTLLLFRKRINDKNLIKNIIEIGLKQFDLGNVDFFPQLVISELNILMDSKLGLSINSEVKRLDLEDVLYSLFDK